MSLARQSLHCAVMSHVTVHHPITMHTVHAVMTMHHALVHGMVLHHLPRRHRPVTVLSICA
ncbi:hypothetical protein LGH83_18345 [Lichenihabitans sp. PAMC28606]|uniref:hypothetical protein n=1 Tax=Lichenihabitans sp. PAMC28606 TaxID=2880932 RepID=UPI001D0AE6E2|nr:hypothetical protein [Lichenihabitans sp. PAMC28606]UDL94437.1 hypothetical protein LGH83_18345 [Lichenihabitans sp. PAMC28606]